MNDKDREYLLEMSKNGLLPQSLETISYHLKNEVAGIILIADTIRGFDSGIDVSLVSSIDYRVKTYYL